LVQRLSDTLTRINPASVMIPLGLFHEDHAQVLEAALAVWPLFDACLWFAYSEALYRRKPGLLQERLAALLERGICATPTALGGRNAGLKARAVAQYASQLAQLGLRAGQGDDAEPECYWQLMPKQGAP